MKLLTTLAIMIGVAWGACCDDLETTDPKMSNYVLEIEHDYHDCFLFVDNILSIDFTITGATVTDVNCDQGECWYTYDSETGEVHVTGSLSYPLIFLVETISLDIGTYGSTIDLEDFEYVIRDLDGNPQYYYCNPEDHTLYTDKKGNGSTQ